MIDAASSVGLVPFGVQRDLLRLEQLLENQSLGGIDRQKERRLDTRLERARNGEIAAGFEACNLGRRLLCVDELRLLDHGRGWNLSELGVARGRELHDIDAHGRDLVLDGWLDR